MKQNGFSLISSIILLVVLSLLATFMVRMSGNLQMGTTLNLQTSRVYYAALSGLEWARANIEQQSGSICGGVGTNCCPALLGQNFSVEPGIVNIQISIDQCSVQNIEETTAYDAYHVTVTATKGNEGETGFAAKQLQGSFFNPAQ